MAEQITINKLKILSGVVVPLKCTYIPSQNKTTIQWRDGRNNINYLIVKGRYGKGKTLWDVEQYIRGNI